MEKLSPKKKLAVVRLYLSGFPYDEIALKGGVSKGTVANVVAELKAGVFPEAADGAGQIELLRELALELRHLGMSAAQCAVGLAVLGRIGECGLDAADIDKWPAILKAAGSEEQARECVALVHRIGAALEKSGMTLEEADEKIRSLEAKAAKLEPVAKQVEERRRELADLTKRRDNLAPIVNNLKEKYDFLKPRSQDLEKRESELSRRIREQEGALQQGEAALAALTREKQDIIRKADAALGTLAKEQQKLLEAGFSVEALANFNDRTRAIAARQKVPLAALRERLLRELEMLDKGLTLEALIGGEEAELRKHQQTTASAVKEQDALKAAVAVLQHQKAALEGGIEDSIKATRDKVNAELARIIPAARDAASGFAKELELGNRAVLDGVRLLKDQALEIGKEIGRYQGIIQVNEWLVELLSLARGEDSVEAGRVRIMLLQVLRGAHSRMKAIEAKSGYVPPAYTTGKLIGELEQWKT